MQITFDKAKIKSYRLIGYENRVLDNDDFENDDKDAGEIGAGQTITALYEVVPVSEGSADEGILAVFDFRYKKELGDGSVAVSLDIVPSDVLNVSSELNFAAGVAAYGMVLRNSPYKGESSFKMAAELASAGLDFDPYGYREDFIDVVNAAAKLAENH